MPIYEYRCKGCGEIFEMFRLISERDATVKCPVCGKTDSERMISSFFGAFGGASGAAGYSADSCGTQSFG